MKPTTQPLPLESVVGQLRHLRRSTDPATFAAAVRAVEHVDRVLPMDTSRPAAAARPTWHRLLQVGRFCQPTVASSDLSGLSGISYSLTLRGLRDMVREMNVHGVLIPVDIRCYMGSPVGWIVRLKVQGRRLLGRVEWEGHWRSGPERPRAYQNATGFIAPDGLHVSVLLSFDSVTRPGSAPHGYATRQPRIIGASLTHNPPIEPRRAIQKLRRRA